MKLFQFENYSVIDGQGLPQISTPLGDLRFVLSIIPQTRPLGSSFRRYKHNSKSAVIYQWLESTFVIELMSVSCSLQESADSCDLTCQGFIIRVQALVPQLITQFSLTWLPGYRWIEGYPESGEGLEARTWCNEQWKTTIGTEDYEFLAARARVNAWMPSRLANSIEESADTIVGMTTDSVTINIPELSINERCQVQFVVATDRKKNADDLSTWLAVAQPHRRLLAYGDCQ